jgi:hypothetical protein
MAKRKQPDLEAALRRIGTEHKDHPIGFKRLEALGQEFSSDVSGPAFVIGMNRLQKGLYHYLVKGDINELKKRAYQSAVLRRFQLHCAVRHSIGSSYPAELYDVLLSDAPALIHWYSQHMLMAIKGSYKGRAKWFKPGSREHFVVQSRRALLGQWELLAEEADKGQQAKSRWQLDYRFMLALARQNLSEMEAALDAQFQGREFSKRCKEPSFGLIEHSIHGWGFLWSKIAWRHGFELVYDSPWIPQDLLPIKPLPEDQYRTDIPVIDEFELFTPFRDQLDSAPPEFFSMFSPLPLGQVLDIDQAIKAEAEAVAAWKKGQPLEAPGSAIPRPDASLPHQNIQVTGRVKMIDMPQAAPRIARKARRAANQIAVNEYLTEQGFELAEGGKLPAPEGGEGEGFEHVGSGRLPTGEIMTVIVSSRPDIRNCAFQLEFDVDNNMQLSTPWINRILNLLPDDDDAKQMIQSAEIIKTAIAGKDMISHKFEFIVVNADKAAP